MITPTTLSILPKLITTLGVSTLGFVALTAGPVQAQGPSVTSVMPVRNAVAAPLTTPVSVSFDQPLSTSPTTLGALKVFSQQAGGTKAGTATVSGNTLTFNPAAGFKPGETVWATVTQAAQSSGGQNLAKPQVFQFTTATTPSNGVFSGGFQPYLGTNPGDVAFGDIDNDGDLDLFIQDPYSVIIRLNTGGANNFSSGISLPARTWVNLALGDLDNDGDLDFIAGNTLGLNRGSNTFSVGTLNPDNSAIYGGKIALGDIDGDGDLDMLTSNSSSNMISVALNNGAALFAKGPNISAGGSVANLALGDLDNDGDLDLLTANGTVSVQLNNGAGSFSGTTNVEVGAAPYDVVAADVDGDGDLDMVTANANSQSVSVRLNDGRASFSRGQDLGVGASPYSVAVGDVDGDGKLDLCTANQGNSTASVCLNSGNGSFINSQQVAVGLLPNSIALGDLDGDGDLDLATADFSSNTASIRLNQAQPPTLPTITSLSATNSSVGNTIVLTGANLINVKEVTFNGVSVPANDILVNSSTQLTAKVPVGATTGLVVVRTTAGASNGVSLTLMSSFAVTNLVPTRNAVAAPRATPVAVSFNQTLGNFDPQQAIRVFSQQAGGRKAGIATVAGNTLTFTPNLGFKGGETVYATLRGVVENSNGSSAQAQVFQFTTATAPSTGVFSGGSDVATVLPYAIATGDIDGDGDLDILTGSSTSISIRLNNGSGTFDSGQELISPPTAYVLALGDIDGDSDLDLLASSMYTGGQVFSWRNNGTGTFTSSQRTSVGSGTSAVRLGDIDGDGDLDLVTANYIPGTVSIRLNDGTGLFAGNQELNAAPAETIFSLALGDVDNDGDLDLVTGNGIRLNNGSGNFGGSQQSGFGSLLGDVDGDGDLDVIGNGVRLNDGSGFFASAQQPGVGGTTLADIDGDGDLDLLVASSTNIVNARLNNGSGIFSAIQPVATINNPASQLVVGDADNDGDIDLFAASSSIGIVSVRLNGNGVLASSAAVAAELSVYPNPAQENFTLAYTANKSQTATLTLTDGLGRVVHQQIIVLQSGLNRVPVQTSAITAGLYHLTLGTADGQRHSQKLLMQP